MQDQLTDLCIRLQKQFLSEVWHFLPRVFFIETDKVFQGVKGSAVAAMLEVSSHIGLQFIAKHSTFCIIKFSERIDGYRVDERCAISFQDIEGSIYYLIY